jgi:molecular chaperone DnaK (HSP70)
MNDRRPFSAKDIIESAKTEAQNPGPVPASPRASAGELVIGVDFGTTFTGVAYAISSSIGKDRTTPKTQAEAEALSEKVVVIKNWPNAGLQAAEKTPTVLAYQAGRAVAWGGRVRPSHRVQIAHFKLGLQENIAQHYWEENPTGTGISLLGGFLKDSNWRHESLPDKSPVDFTADYLREVRKYVTETILPTHYGAEFLSGHRISFALTVPAIWTDKAKDLTMRAAIRAGIPENRLVLISEPEAAALYCATMCTEVDLKDGDRFLVCDAGGGTVVRH